jgi:hypothetical protein
MIRSMISLVVACLLVTGSVHAGDKAVKVFILAGQSNMEGKAMGETMLQLMKDQR